MSDAGIEWDDAALDYLLHDEDGPVGEHVADLGGAVLAHARDNVHVWQGPGGGKLRDSLTVEAERVGSEIEARVGPDPSAPRQESGRTQAEALLAEEFGSRTHGPTAVMRNALYSVKRGG